MPCVFKRCNLGLRLRPIPFSKKDVISGLGIERRVKVNQIHGFVGYVLSEDLEVIAEVELVFPFCLYAHETPLCSLPSVFRPPVLRFHPVSTTAQKLPRPTPAILS